jgi:predicted ATPase/DNA-binding NarL/FixJ family response regulator
LITHGGRLPAETSRFFGRSKEAAAIRDALSRSRLITVIGPGGVGKTRLALRVADGLTDAFPDGVRLVPLSTARDTNSLVHAVAAALGLPAEARAPDSADALAEPSGFAERVGRLTSGLHGRRMLLILDTCEYLVDACAAFAAAVLSDADGPVILATSRQPLDLPGEVVFRIAPLDVADDGGDAVALFADRAGAAVPGFVLTDDALPKAVRLCRALDGIPLEIEMAALRLRAVSLDELLSRLPGRRLRLLVGGRRADDRQQTMQASITWSYDLCTPAERLLWTRLSVFSGGFSLAAAEAVCAGGELAVGEVLETLVGLVDKSVVLRADVAGGDARYRLLEVVREQGVEQAGDADAAECAARHRDHYLGVARRFATAFVGSDQVRLVSRLAQDAANLRLALEWSLGNGRHAVEGLDPGRELAVACLPWWACTGQLGEASRWFSRFSQDNPDHQPERSRGSTPPASPPHDLAEPAARARCLTGWPLVAHGKAVSYPIADLVASLAAAFESLTRAAFDECTARCAALMAGLPDGERWVRGWAAWVTGVAGWLGGGDVAAAERRLREGLELHAPFGDGTSSVPTGGNDLSVAQHLEVFAWLAAARGEHRRTGRLQGAADLRWRRLTERGSVSVPRLGVALLHIERDRAERAARDSLGPAGYGAEHEAGAALSRRDTLRYALGELPAQPARRQPEAGQPTSGQPVIRLPLPGWSSGDAGPGSEAADQACRWHLLTSREREVAVLVAEGMSNKGIAARLFVSKRTIDAHIEHILAKLSYASRVQIAALVLHEQGSYLPAGQTSRMRKTFSCCGDAEDASCSEAE